MDTNRLNAANPSPRYDTEEARWLAIASRDRAADGHFVYAVKTTGVYCHPSALTKLPKRENVRFFASAREAEAAGFRPNKRSIVDRTQSQRLRDVLVRHACELMDSADNPLSLHQLAEQLGVSPFHLHRVFKAETGLTPKLYANAARARRVRQQLGNGEAGTVTQAVYDAGFNSSSRFYDTSDALLGMSPGNYRAGGMNARIHFAVGECSLGHILVAQSQRGVCAVLLGDDPDKLARDLEDLFPNAELIGGDGQFEQVVAQVVGFVEAPALGLTLPLDIRGTAFQERVWRALQEIPAGQTATYTEIAARIGAPNAVRAVGTACGANRIAVASPCHRVLRRDGDLSGYRWGVERKRKLLQRESGSTS
jgi:AraC family transcriptional regulator of adaptative response/methylated-DNA-[protein]-cysteine methyltransferase